MRRLLRKTMELARWHPIVWVPYVCADLTASCLTWLRRLGTRGLIHWFAETNRGNHSHSVLEHNTISFSFGSPTIQTAEKIHAILVWGTHYANIFVYTIALVLTAILVAMIIRGENPSLKAAIASLSAYPKRASLYSFKSWFLMLALYIAVFLIAERSLESTLHLNPEASLALANSLDIFNRVFIAWVMAPIAIALLRPAGAPAVSHAYRQLGRYLYILVTTSAFFIGYVLDPLILKLPLKATTMSAALDLTSVITNSPYVLLYIALALLASEVSLAPGEYDGSRFRALMQSLMPLHFQKDKTP